MANAKALAVDIPQSFRLPPEQSALKGELERLAAGVVDFGNRTRRTFTAIPEVRPEVLIGGEGSAQFDQLTKVAPATTTTIINLQLPQPAAENIGREVRVQRTGVLGLVVMRPTGLNQNGVEPLVNGQSSMMLSNALGFTSFTFDGLNYYSDNPGNGPLYTGTVTP
jgi:hypothetical protein